MTGSGGGSVPEWEASWTRQPAGWDFSDVATVMEEDAPPWDFDALCLDALARARDVLDLGTGGGEQLLRLLGLLGGSGARRPRQVVATEGWAPNVPVARAALSPFGIRVLDYDADSRSRLPLDDGSIDLVLDRHEAYDPAEVARVLRPGGVLLTQQVGSRDADETAAWFGRPERPAWSLAVAARGLEAVGLRVLDGGEHVGQYRFADVAALLRYLSHVPWDLPADFAVGDHLDALARLRAEADAGRPVVLTRDRWWLRAVRPGGDAGPGPAEGPEPARARAPQRSDTA